MQRFGWTAPALILSVLVATSAAHAQETTKPQHSAWVKLCEKATAVVKDKDGKDEKKDLNICLTHHERLDGNTGMVLVSAAVRQVEGQDKQGFMVMVPLGVSIPSGMRATIYPMGEGAEEREDRPDQAEEREAQLYTVPSSGLHR